MADLADYEAQAMSLAVQLLDITHRYVAAKERLDDLLAVVVDARNHGLTSIDLAAVERILWRHDPPRRDLAP